MEMAMLRLLREQRFDVVLFHGREALPVLKGVKVPVVVECGDTNCSRILLQMQTSSVWLRPRLLLHYFKLRRLEKTLARQTPYRFFISERDRTNLLGALDQSAIVPQGIDYEYWKRSAPPPNHNCIVFSGVMSYPPNADAALVLLNRILPQVRQAVPSLEVLIVGREPPSKLVNLARRYPDVTVTGAVDDMRPHLERADIYVAALRFASGVQNKVLEAMSMEVPVITTPVVAAGLRVDDAEPPLVIRQNPEEIVASIISLLANPKERARLGLDGRRFVEAHCSWSRSADQLEELCIAAAHSMSGSRVSDQFSNASVASCEK